MLWASRLPLDALGWEVVRVGRQVVENRRDDAAAGVTRRRPIRRERIALVDQFQRSIGSFSVCQTHEQIREGECRTGGASGLQVYGVKWIGKNLEAEIYVHRVLQQCAFLKFHAARFSPAALV